MESSSGFMAVLAVSGTVVLLAAQFHKRLFSGYMDRLELQFDGKKKKKVRFAEDVMEPSGNNREYRRKNRDRRNQKKVEEEMCRRLELYNKINI